MFQYDWVLLTWMPGGNKHCQSRGGSSGLGGCGGSRASGSRISRGPYSRLDPHRSSRRCVPSVSCLTTSSLSDSSQTLWESCQWKTPPVRAYCRLDPHHSGSRCALSVSCLTTCRLSDVRHGCCRPHGGRLQRRPYCRLDQHCSDCKYALSLLCLTIFRLADSSQTQ